MAPPKSFKPEIVALFGQPVAENPTGYMMERAFDRHGLNWRYVTLEIAPRDLPDAIRGMRAMRFRGANCTLPHKVAVTAQLDRLSDAARLIGAVNCIVRDGDQLVGENTDGKGFLESLKQVIEPVEKNVVIFGAGGAARAIAVELALAAVNSMVIVNRSGVRGRELACHLVEALNAPARFAPWESEYPVPAETDVVINATSIGLHPHGDARPAIDYASLAPHMVVADVIPNPPRTSFLKAAEARGCRTIDGLGMLVNQGVISFRLWTGLEPDASVMRSALEEVLV